MRSLLEDGKIKILKGVTTPDEIARIAQVEGVALTEEELGVGTESGAGAEA
jgi:hypothetical protein